MSGHESIPAESIVVGPEVSELNSFAEIDHHPQDECGVFGIYAPGEPVIQLTIAALQELQHRGQSGAGIAYVNNNERTPSVDGKPGEPVSMLVVHKEEGLVPEALSSIFPSARRHDGFHLPSYEKVIGSPLAVGHVRYSTMPGEGHSGAHPHQGDESGIALVHNGELHNMVGVAKSFGVDVVDVAQKLGVSPEYVSDSALLTQTIDSVTDWYETNQPGQQDSLLTALKRILPKVDGAYALTITDRNRVIGVSDPWANRPLSYGKLDNDTGYMIASEGVIFNTLGGKFIDDFEPGEIVILDDNGVTKDRIDRVEPTMHCSFEWAYTSRPDGTIYGSSVYESRKNFGKYVALDNKEKFVGADIVVGVPDSGTISAMSFAETLGKPYKQAITLNRYSGRTFIERADTGRQDRIATKYRYIESEIRDRKIIIMDDSAVKGNTHKEVADNLWALGAAEVHLVLSVPEYKNACYMGNDTHDVSLLVAHGRTNEEIAEHFGVTSVTFNTTERWRQSIIEAISDPKKLRRFGGVCMACADDVYPFSINQPQELRLWNPDDDRLLELVGQS